MRSQSMSIGRHPIVYILKKNLIQVMTIALRAAEIDGYKLPATILYFIDAARTLISERIPALY
jgi:hypothetical protein